MTKTTLTDGSPVTPDHREINPATGMQKGYVVLSEEERAKGFVEPVRTSYLHLKCGTVTTMSMSLAETYARDPFFYSGTFCCGCRNHFPVGEDGEFVWDGTDQRVGTKQQERPAPRKTKALDERLRGILAGCIPDQFDRSSVRQIAYSLADALADHMDRIGFNDAAADLRAQRHAYGFDKAAAIEALLGLARLADQVPA